MKFAFFYAKGYCDNCQWIYCLNGFKLSVDYPSRINLHSQFRHYFSFNALSAQKPFHPVNHANDINLLKPMIYNPWCELSLKPMYSFGKWWKWKMSLMGFVYRVVWVLKALCIFLSETIHFLRKLHKTKILGCPRKFSHRVMYIHVAPSSGHISLNSNMPFRLILKKEVCGCFLMSGVRMLHFRKIDGNSFKSINTILWL